jgi:hypothetical protein
LPAVCGSKKLKSKGIGILDVRSKIGIGSWSIFLLVMVFSHQAMASVGIKNDSLWKSNGVFNLGIGQTSFTNWAAGGDNNINITTSLLYDLIYKKDIINWNTNVDFRYGTLMFLDKNSKKTDDQIHMSSKLGYELDSSFSMSFLFSFDSQFTNGYKYPNDSVPISRFMAPAYILLGVGMDYKPNKSLSILVSPYTNKITVVNDYDLSFSGAYGMTPAETDTAGNILVPASRFRNEPGGYIKVNFTHTFGKVFKLTSRLELFSSYFNNPANLDVRANLIGLYKISQRTAVTFTLDILYDEDAKIRQDIDGDGVEEVVGPRTQVKQSLALGLALKF